MNRFSGAVRGLGMGISNGGAAFGGTLGVGRFEFDDASPQVPATSDIRRGDSIASPALAAVMVRLEVVRVGDQGVTVRLRRTPRALMSSLGCFPPSALVGVRAVLPALL